MKFKRLLGVVSAAALMISALPSSTMAATSTYTQADIVNVEFNVSAMDLGVGSNYNYYDLGDSNTVKSYDAETGEVTLTASASKFKFMPYVGNKLPEGKEWYYVSYEIYTTPSNDSIDGKYGTFYATAGQEDAGGFLNHGILRANGYAGSTEGLTQEYNNNYSGQFSNQWSVYNKYMKYDYYFDYSGDDVVIYKYVNGKYDKSITSAKGGAKIGNLIWQTQADSTITLKIKNVKYGYGTYVNPNGWVDEMGFDGGAKIDLSNGSSYNYYDWGNSNTTKTYDANTGIINLKTNDSQVKFMPYINKNVPSGKKWYYVTYSFKENEVPTTKSFEPFGKVYGTTEVSDGVYYAIGSVRHTAFSPDGIFQMYDSVQYGNGSNPWLKNGSSTDTNLYGIKGNWQKIEFYIDLSVEGQASLYYYVNGTLKGQKVTTVNTGTLGDIKFQTSGATSFDIDIKDIKYAYGDDKPVILRNWIEDEAGLEVGKQINLSESSSEYNYHNFDNSNTVRSYDSDTGVLNLKTNDSMVKFMTYNRSGKEYVPIGYKYYYASYKTKTNTVTTENALEPYMAVSGLDRDMISGTVLAMTALRGSSLGGANGLIQFYSTHNYQGWDKVEGTYPDYRLWSSVGVWTKVEYYGVRNDNGTSTLVLFINGNKVAETTQARDIERLGSFVIQSNKNETADVSIKEVRFAYGNECTRELGLASNKGYFADASGVALEATTVAHGTTIKAVVEDAVDSVQIYKVYNNGKGDDNGHELTQVTTIPSTIAIDTEGIAAVELQYYNSEGLVESKRIDVTGYAPELFFVNSKGEKVASNSVGGDMGSYYIVDGDNEQMYACYTTVPTGYFGANIYESATAGSMFINDVNWGSYDLAKDIYKVALPTASTKAFVKRHKIQFVQNTATESWSIAIEAGYVESASVTTDGTSLTYTIKTCNNELFPTQFIAAVYSADDRLLDAKYASSNVEGGVYSVTISGTVEGGAYVKLFTYDINTLLKPVHKAYTYSAQ